MNPLARRRVAAHALDCVSYLGIAAATVPAGLIATRAGLGKSRRFVVWASAIPVALATTVATAAEARGATWGKHRLGLTVERTEGGLLPILSALARNVVKIAIPWQLGHVIAIGASHGGFKRPEPGLVAASIATYGLVGVGLWGVLRDSGVTVHDMIAGSRVLPSEPDDRR